VGGSDQAAAAEVAYQDDLVASQRTMGIAMPLLKEIIGYAKGQISAGEPGYVKEGYAQFNQSLRDRARGATAEDLSAAFAGPNAPQGGAAISEIGKLRAGGGGNEAQALSASSLSEGKTMYLHTQALLDAMSGTAGSGIGTSVAQAQERISAIAGMRQYNPTTANILGVLGAGTSIYGALNQPSSLGTTNGFPNSMGPGGFGYSDPVPVNVTTGGGG